MERRPNTLDTLLTLVRAALWGRDAEAAALPCLHDAEWQALFDEACRQTVAGLAFAGLCRLPAPKLPPKPLSDRWAAVAALIARQNRQMQLVAEEVSRLCGAVGITPIQFKGLTVAALYPQPSLRECGDIDLYFGNDDRLQRAAQAVGRSHPLSPMPEGGYTATLMGVKIELHRSMFALLPAGQQRELRQLEESEPFAASPCKKMLMPGATLNLAMLSLHILKHSAAFGIGLRQLCDLAVAYRRTLPHAHNAWLTGFYRRHHLQRWSAMTDTFLHEQLGVERSCTLWGDRVSPRPLRRIVEAGGNFGLRPRSPQRNEPPTARLATVARNLLSLWPYAPQNVAHLTGVLLHRCLR